MKHPENRGDRNPLASRKIKRQLLKNRFVAKKKLEPSVKQDEAPVTKAPVELDQ